MRLLINVNGMRGWLTGQPEAHNGRVFERVTYLDHVTMMWHRNRLVPEDQVKLGWEISACVR